MSVDYQFKKGIDIPQWQWLTFFQQGTSNHGAASCFDGKRYLYYAVQYSTTSGIGTAGTTQLWRYDTFTNGWQFLANLTGTNAGIDIEYDDERSVIWIVEGNNSTAWRYFNPNRTSVTVAGVTTAAMTLSAVQSVVLPGAASNGANLVIPAMVDVPAMLRTGTADSGSTATVIYDLTDVDFHAGYVGCDLRFTTGALAGQSRVITAAASVDQITVGAAFTAAPAVGDTYVIEAPGNGGVARTATGGSTTTLVQTGSGWPVNVYRDHDVEILTGTGAGQRRRIASNTADTLTLMATATAGNARTGPFTTAPVAGSTYRIIPSTDFLYYNPGAAAGSTAFYRTDVVATTRVWTTLAVFPAAVGGGGVGSYAPRFAPFSLVFFRGVGTATVYRYDIGANTHATLPSLWGAETLNTGGTVARMPGGLGFFVHAAATTRITQYNPATGLLTPSTNIPYATPAGYDGKRMRFVYTPDGANFLYFLRAGGQEFFRLPLEFIDA